MESWLQVGLAYPKATLTSLYPLASMDDRLMKTKNHTFREETGLMKFLMTGDVGNITVNQLKVHSFMYSKKITMYIFEYIYT